MSDVDDDNSNIPKNTIELMYVHEPICFYYWNNMLSNVQFNSGYIIFIYIDKNRMSDDRNVFCFEGSGIKTHSLVGACSSHTGSELQLYVLYPLNSIKKFTQTVIQ